ncbi:MAG: ATP-binding cassette domain-containing protein [Pseudonocardia sp.]
MGAHQLAPTAGTATVTGVDLLREPVEVRRRIGYVGQGGGASPDVPVLEELVVHGRLYGLSAAEARRRGGTLLDQLNLGDTGSRLVGTLSGGQKRRLDIAMDLIHTPRLIFLDEPSTGLDPQGRANLWTHVRGLRDEHGATVFLTTHYLDEADALCDRVLVIDGGKIIAQGTPEELKSRISGDQVTFTVDPAQTAAAARLAAAVPQATELVADAGTIRMRVPRGAIAMPTLLRELDHQGVTALSIEVHRPTLDDVFLTLTGRSLRDAEQASAGSPTPDLAGARS